MLQLTSMLLAAVGFAAQASVLDAPLITIPTPIAPVQQFAVIQTEQADYLQAEFSGLAGGTGVRLDSIVVLNSTQQGSSNRGNLEVHWRWAEAGKDSIPPAVGRIQFLYPFGANQTMVAKPRVPFDVDTIWSCHGGRCVLTFGQTTVRNWEPSRMICAIACLEPVDSASYLQTVRQRINRTGLAVVLTPSPISYLVKPWSVTTGDEELTSICAKLPGNAGNWLSLAEARFEVRAVAYPSAAKSRIPKDVDYPTGWADYVYDRAATPISSVLETTDFRVYHDTLLKIGNTLSLSGITKFVCGRPINDTEAILHSWLAVPDSASPSSIFTALQPGFCGARTSAWKIQGDTVWLREGKWPVLLKDLLSSTSLRDVDSKPAASGPSLAGRQLSLPWTAFVVVRDLSGRVLIGARSFEPGTHPLPVHPGTGPFLVEIRHPGEAARSLIGIMP